MEHVLSATWRFDCVATMEPEVPCKVSDSISAQKQEGVFLTLGRKKKVNTFILNKLFFLQVACYGILMKLLIPLYELLRTRLRSQVSQSSQQNP